MDDDDQRRLSLERAAFGDGASADERRRALRALAALDARRFDEPARRDPEAPTAGVAGEPRGPRGHKPLLAAGVGALVVALVVGGVAGAALTRSGALGQAAHATATASADATIDAGPQSAVAEADALLASPREASDHLPKLVAANSAIIASTSHLVATSAQGEKLFVAEESGLNVGYCLVTATGSHDFGQADGAVHCEPIKSFARSGVSITSAGYTAHWKAGRVIVTVGD